MVQYRWRNFLRRRKIRVFITLLTAFAAVSVYLNWVSWKHKMVLMTGDVPHQRTTEGAIISEQLLVENMSRLNKKNKVPTSEEDISGLNKKNQRPTALTVDSRNATNMRNLLKDLGTLNMLHASWIKALKNITKIENVSQHTIGHLTSKPRPMAAVDPVDNDTKLLSCKEIAEIQIIRQLGKGYTKVVDLGRYRGRDVAVKRVKPSVKDVETCKKKVDKKRWHECYNLANYKIMKEIFMQQQLQHPNIAKVLGYCVRSERIADSLANHGVVAVTEAGSAFGSKALNLKRRLETAIDIASLLAYLEHSPLGSLIMADFKASQFVWVGDKVKLTDMDDVSDVERTCKVDNGCRIGNRDVGVRCTRNVCPGLNAKHNMDGAFRAIFRNLLANNGTEISLLREELRTLTLNATTLHSKLQHLLQLERGNERT